MKLFIITVVVFAVVGCPKAAELTTNEMGGARAQGTNALEAFRRFVTTNDVTRLGFLTTNELYQAVLGEPLRVYRISRTAAKAYVAGQAFATLIEPAPRVIFPLLVNSTNTKSSILVRMENGAWVTENWGGAGLAKQLTSTRDSLAVSNAPAATNSIAVEVPVVGLWFIGYTNANNNTVELLTTVAVTIDGNNVPPQTMVSTTLMEKIAEMATRYGGRAK